MKPSRLLCARAVTALFAVLLPAAEAQSQCDTTVLNSASGNNAYRVRGDRCEGTYGRKVAQDKRLLVVSFVGSLEEYVPRPQGTLNVYWAMAPNASDSVRVAARSFNRKPFYAMDTRRAVSDRRFAWPLEVLFQEQLRRANLGVVAWTEQNVGGARRRIYLPVHVTAGSAAAAGDVYEITLFPSVRPDSLFVTLSQLDSLGAPVDSIWKRRLLNYGIYQAEVPIRIRLPQLPSSGLYQVDILGRQRNGRAIPLDPLVFLHCGKPPHRLC